MENNTKEIILRDPARTEADMANMSESFLNRFLDPTSKTSSWNILQKKIFILVVGQFKSFGNSNVVILENKKVMQELGWNYGRTNFYKVGFKLREELDKMMDSRLRLQDIITKKWYVGNLIVEAEGDLNFTKITLNPKFMNHFNDLYYLATKYGQSYFGLMKPDVLELKNDYAHRLFYDLRLKFKVKNAPLTYDVEYELPELLKTLGIDEGEYLKDGNKEKGIKGKFNFYGFEKRILNSVIEDINTSEQVRFNKNIKGNFYEKTKNGRRISGYKFNVTVNDVHTIKRNREQLIAFAKKQGFYVETEPEWISSMIIDEGWQGSWNLKERPIIDTEIVEDENENEYREFDIMNLDPCFEDYEKVRPITTLKEQALKKASEKEAQIQALKDEIYKNQRMLKELENGKNSE